MSTQRSADDVMKEMNDLATAQGKHLDKAFWEIPRDPGSLLDVPETAESRERIGRLRARRQERAAHQACQKDCAESMREQAQTENAEIG